MKRVPDIISAFQVRRLSTERLSNLPRAAQLESDRAEITGRTPRGQPYIPKPSGENQTTGTTLKLSPTGRCEKGTQETHSVAGCSHVTSFEMLQRRTVEPEPEKEPAPLQNQPTTRLYIWSTPSLHCCPLWVNGIL